MHDSMSFGFELLDVCFAVEIYIMYTKSGTELYI
jgi:hypothetical protein